MKKWFVILNVLNILDIITTLIALHLGLVESNILMDTLIQLSPWIFISIKLIVGVGCAIILYYANSTWGFIITCSLFGIVVISNIIHIIGVI